MGYGCFARFYDELTENVDYGEKCRYILSLFKRYNYNPGITLDLACGTGALTCLLKEAGVDIYGVDQSEEMLSAAMEKSIEKGLSILFLCQQMQSLDLFGTINTCVSTMDSLNHLDSLQELDKTFAKISLFMEKDGLFIFDVNSPFKHRDILADNAFVYEKDDVFCVWQNETDENLVTDICIDFFVKDGASYKRETECFAERAFFAEQIEGCLVKNSFELVDIFGENTFLPPKEDEQRLVFVAKKLTQPKSFQENQ